MKQLGRAAALIILLFSAVGIAWAATEVQLAYGDARIRGDLKLGNRTVSPSVASATLAPGDLTLEAGGNSTNSTFKMESRTSGGTVRAWTIKPSQSMTGNHDWIGLTALPGSGSEFLKISSTGQLSTTGSAGVTGSGTDTHLAIWDGTTALQDSNWLIDAGGMLYGDITAGTGAPALLIGDSGTSKLQINNDGAMLFGSSLLTGINPVSDGVLGLQGSGSPAAWRLYESPGSGSEYVSITVPSSIGTSRTFPLPTDNPADGEQLTWHTGGTTSWDSAGGSGGGITSLTLSGDSGSDQTLGDGDTIEIAGGTNGIDTAAGATDTVTLNFDASEVGSVTWGTAPTWTFPTSALFTTGFLGLGNGSTAGGALRFYEDTDFGTNYYEFACTGPLAADMSIPLKYDSGLSDGDVFTYHTGGVTWDTPATTYYQTIKEEGSGLTQRAAINFNGRSVTATDDSGNDETDVTIVDTWSINVQALTSSPTDAQTIYFGMLPKAPVTAADTSKIYIPKSGTIKAANIYCYSGTAGTNENWSLYIRLNNTTDTLIETIGASAKERNFDNSSLSISVSAGDYIEIKAVNPTWATNPLTTIFGGYVMIES